MTHYTTRPRHECRAGSGLRPHARAKEKAVARTARHGPSDLAAAYFASDSATFGAAASAAFADSLGITSLLTRSERSL